MSDRDVDAHAQSGNFFARWSRRKLAPKADDGVPLVATPAAPVVDEPSPSPAPSDPPLPSLDALDEASDYSAFLGPDVAEELQRLALRKLFAGAGFNVRDGLDDYADDYRCFDPLGDTVTADMRHRLERELGTQLSQEAPPEQAPATTAATPHPNSTTIEDDSDPAES